MIFFVVMRADVSISIVRTSEGFVALWITAFERTIFRVDDNCCCGAAGWLLCGAPVDDDMSGAYNR